MHNEVVIMVSEIFLVGAKLMINRYKGPDMIPNLLPGKAEELCYKCWGRMEHTNYLEIHRCKNCGWFRTLEDRNNFLAGNKE